MRLLAVCLLSAVLAPGCASGKNYAINRSADLADIIRGHIMFGPGIAVKLEATRLLHAGGTYTHNTFAWGIHNRAISAWRESSWSWGLIVGAHHEDVTGVDYVSGSYGWDFTGEGESGVFKTATGGLDLDLLTCRGTLMLFVGLDLEVRVGEVLDFIAGIFQFDPSGDDADYESMRRPAEPVEPIESEPVESAALS